MFRPLRSGLAALALAAASFGSGCTDSSGPRAIPWNLFAPRPALGPVPDSPQNAARLLQWCWSRLDTTIYRTLFTRDYQFVFGALDPNGNAYRATPWTRTDELISFAHLVGGGDANQPTATRCSVTFDRNFYVADDPRPGKESRWHKSIRTSVTLHLSTEGGEQDLAGYANFFYVRGDSAAVPGARDSTRWYVERWEDDTYPGYGAHAMPATKSSWGSIKALYR
jgi:hypothetical protein